MSTRELPGISQHDVSWWGIDLPRGEFDPPFDVMAVYADRLLGVRARNTLLSLNVRRLSDIREEELLEIPGCGITTTDEILAWVQIEKDKHSESYSY